MGPTKPPIPGVGNLLVVSRRSNVAVTQRANPPKPIIFLYTRVTTLIVATIYLQLIQN